MEESIQTGGSDVSQPDELHVTMALSQGLMKIGLMRATGSPARIYSSAICARRSQPVLSGVSQRLPLRPVLQSDCFACSYHLLGPGRLFRLGCKLRRVPHDETTKGAPSDEGGLQLSFLSHASTEKAMTLNVNGAVGIMAYHARKAMADCCSEPAAASAPQLYRSQISGTDLEGAGLTTKGCS